MQIASQVYKVPDGIALPPGCKAFCTHCSCMGLLLASETVNHKYIIQTITESEV